MTNIVVTGPGRWEPSLVVQRLPRCVCGLQHPLALKPVPQDTTQCPSCGRHTVLDIPKRIDAVGSFWVGVANQLHNISRILLKLIGD